MKDDEALDEVSRKVNRKIRGRERRRQARLRAAYWRGVDSAPGAEPRGRMASLLRAVAELPLEVTTRAVHGSAEPFDPTQRIPVKAKHGRGWRR